MHGVALMLAFLAVPEPTPHLRDLDRFPCHWVAEENYRFYVAHCDWLEGRRQWDLANAHELLSWHWEALRCRQAWYELWWATDTRTTDDQIRRRTSEDQRRKHLSNLRDRLGVFAYEQGLMPQVLLRRFARIER